MLHHSALLMHTQDNYTLYWFTAQPSFSRCRAPYTTTQMVYSIQWRSQDISFQD